MKKLVMSILVSSLLLSSNTAVANPIAVASRLAPMLRPLLQGGAKSIPKQAGRAIRKPFLSKGKKEVLKDLGVGTSAGVASGLMTEIAKQQGLVGGNSSNNSNSSHNGTNSLNNVGIANYTTYQEGETYLKSVDDTGHKQAINNIEILSDSDIEYIVSNVYLGEDGTVMYMESCNDSCQQYITNITIDGDSGIQGINSTVISEGRLEISSEGNYNSSQVVNGLTIK